MKSLLFVGNDAYFFLSHRLPLAIAAQCAGYAIHVAMPEQEDDIAALQIQEQGMTYHRITLQRSDQPLLQELRTIANLHRLYRQVRPDLIHHIAVKAIFYGGIAAMLSGYTQARETVGLFARFRPLRRSRVVAHQTVKHAPTINLQQFGFHPEPAGIPVVMFASRLLIAKGVREFVEAARIIRAKGLPARFVLVGDSPFSHDAISLTELTSWMKNGDIEWWGQKNDMAVVLPQANIVCLPTHYHEGVPQELLEAAACGRAIITSDIAGCREITAHQYNGLLVEPHNSIALAASIEILLRTPHKRERMGFAGRHLVEKAFSVKQVIETTLQAYQNAG